MTAAEPPAVKTWTVRIDLGEHGGETRAVAHLETGAETDLTGRGAAHRNPADPLVPEIGDEVAAARALSQLAHLLLDAAAGDLSDVLHQHGRIEE
jgi:hypothetical protein